MPVKTSNGVTLSQTDQRYQLLLARCTLSVVPLSVIDATGAHFGFTPLTTMFRGVPIVRGLQNGFERLAVEIIVLSWVSFLSISSLMIWYNVNSDTQFQIGEEQRPKSVIGLLGVAIVTLVLRSMSIHWVSELNIDDQANVARGEILFLICFVPFFSACVAYLAGLAILIARR